MRIVKQICIVLVLIISLSGCTKSEQQNETTSEIGVNEKEISVMENGGWSEINGGFLMQLNDMMAYFDFASKMLVPLCTKTECDHEPNISEKDYCTAVLLAKDCSAKMCVYGGYLWYLKWIDFETAAIYRADLSGENAQEMFVVDVGISEAHRVVLYDNYMYIVDKKPVYNKIGAWVGDTERVVKISLEDGTVTEITQAKETQMPLYYVLDVCDGKLYFRDNENDKLFFYDCASGEIGEYPLNAKSLNMMEVRKGYLVYTSLDSAENFTEIIRLRDGKVLQRVNISDLSSYRIYDNEILLFHDEKGYYRYTFDTDEFELVGNEELLRKFWTFCPTGDGYLGEIYVGEYQREYAYMDREAFNRGEYSYKALTEDRKPIW